MLCTARESFAVARGWTRVNALGLAEAYICGQCISSSESRFGLMIVKSVFKFECLLAMLLSKA